MWIPKAEDDIRAAIASGGLVESETFDAKEKVSDKSLDVAVDVAAMATGGGVILYGVGEDARGLATVLKPFQLKGAKERVDQIVQSGISEAPHYRIQEIPTDQADDLGYLALVVPASERAPHMVVVKGENRYYARTPGGNRVMTELEVASLYERRARLGTEAEQLIRKEIEREVQTAHDDYAYLHLAIRPTAPSPDFLLRAGDPTKPGFLPVLEALKIAAAWPLPDDLHFTRDRDVSAEALNVLAHPQAWKRTTRGWMARHLARDPSISMTGTVEIQVHEDGLIGLFAGRIGQRHQTGKMAVFKEFPAAYSARLGQMAGALYDQAGYFGSVHAGAKIAGVLGAFPFNPNAAFIDDSWLYEEAEYERVSQLPAGALVDDWAALGRNLMEPFLDTLTQGRYMPFSPRT